MGNDLQLFTVVGQGGKVRRKFLVEGTLAEAAEKFTKVVHEEADAGEPIVQVGDSIVSEPVEYVRGVCEV